MQVAVSQILREVLIELMDEAVLSAFYIGGGTNLAIKYDHQVSVDIDLFSSGVVGIKKWTMELIDRASMIQLAESKPSEMQAGSFARLIT